MYVHFFNEIIKNVKMLMEFTMLMIVKTRHHSLWKWSIIIINIIIHNNITIQN